MPVLFQALSDSSYDPTSRISIPQPRVLPALLADGRSCREYQYALIRDGVFLDGLGCHGSETLVRAGEGREWIYTIDLGHEHLLKSIVEFKKLFAGADDDDYVFLCGIASGLVLAYAGRTDNQDNLRYVVTTTAEALASAGVPVPDAEPVLADGALVLAQVFIPRVSR